MRFSNLVFGLAATAAVDAYPSMAPGAGAELSARADDHSFQKPGPGDVRSPCPMVNTLANHGYIPRNGKGNNIIQLIKGFGDAVHLSAPATTLVGAKALTTGNYFTFNLDDLDKHGIIEHDGSLSRSDAALGDNHSFNATIWNAVAANFKDKTISIPVAAAARKQRVAAAKAANPAFNWGDGGETFSFIETALYLSVFGNPTDGNARTDWVDMMFREERLADDYKKPADTVGIVSLLSMVNKIKDASK